MRQEHCRSLVTSFWGPICRKVSAQSETLLAPNAQKQTMVAEIWSTRKGRGFVAASSLADKKQGIQTG